MIRTLHTVFGILGNLSALCLFVCPVKTFRNIYQKGSTGDFSGLPYAMTLLNCLVSGWYGLPFVSPHNTLLSIVNFIGAAFAAVFVLLFIIFASSQGRRNKMLFRLALVLIVVSAVVLVSLFALHGKGRKLFCGFVATTFCVLMYGAPLDVAVTVIKTKSVENMPLLVSFFVLLTSTLWSVYGLLGHDLFVLVPNLLGCALGAMQMVIYCMYRNHNKTGEARKAGEAS